MTDEGARHRVLVRLRDDALRRDVLSVARAAGYATEEAHSDTQAIAAVRDGGLDVALLEIGCQEDLGLMRELRRGAPDLGVIATAASPDVDLVVGAFREGVLDFLRMPFDVSTVERALVRSRRARQIPSPAQRFLTRDPATRRLLDQLDRVADSDATVSLFGESGTGKDLLARWIHQASPRRHGRFVVVNCAGLAPDLAESELFGHARGAFTGAHEARAGRLEEANGGTLVLDEVGDLAPVLQPKLLRALQEREVQPLGARTPRPLDIRVLVTTQRDLAREVESGRFRADLYYRLDVVSLRVPPLRERPGDLELLARAFLERFADANGSRPAELGDDVLAQLAECPFRGNVRELENLMRRAALLFPGAPIEWERLRAPAPAAKESPAADLRSVNLRDLERQAVIRSLEMTHGNRTLASKALGISVRTLRNKIRLYGLA